MLVMYGNFPEKSISTGDNMARKLLKRCCLSSTSFPKTPVLGSVSCSSYSPTVALLAEVVVSVLPLTLHGTLEAAAE
jgi:hypothetical protein